MTWVEWYDALAKPIWTPDGGTIGLIWTLLYPVIAVTFGYVFVQAARRKIPRSVAVPFAVNLVANVIFTPIQFGLRNLPLAAADILVVLGTLVWVAARRRNASRTRHERRPRIDCRAQSIIRLVHEEPLGVRILRVLRLKMRMHIHQPRHHRMHGQVD